MISRKRESKMNVERTMLVYRRGHSPEEAANYMTMMRTSARYRREVFVGRREGTKTNSM